MPDRFHKPNGFPKLGWDEYQKLSAEQRLLYEFERDQANTSAHEKIINCINDLSKNFHKDMETYKDHQALSCPFRDTIEDIPEIKENATFAANHIRSQKLIGDSEEKRKDMSRKAMVFWISFLIGILTLLVNFQAITVWYHDKCLDSQVEITPK